jgi:hypothetical protein
MNTANTQPKRREKKNRGRELLIGMMSVCKVPRASGPFALLVDEYHVRPSFIFNDLVKPLDPRSSGLISDAAGFLPSHFC